MVRKKSVTVSLIACYVLAAALLILCIFGPQIFELYMTIYRGFKPNGEAMLSLKKVFISCFYPCAVFAGFILFSLIKLLKNIKAELIFIEKNVKYLKTVFICCFAIAIITFVGAFFYMPFGFISLAAVFVGILLRVLKNIMQCAVELRQENDLTI